MAAWNGCGHFVLLPACCLALSAGHLILSEGLQKKRTGESVSHACACWAPSAWTKLDASALCHQKISNRTVCQGLIFTLGDAGCANFEESAHPSFKGKGFKRRQSVWGAWPKKGVCEGSEEAFGFGGIL